MFLSDKTDVSPDCSTCLSMMVSLFNILPHRFLNYVCVLYTSLCILALQSEVLVIPVNCTGMFEFLFLMLNFHWLYFSSKGINSTRCNVISYTLPANQEESKHLKVIKSNILPMQCNIQQHFLKQFPWPELLALINDG